MRRREETEGPLIECACACGFCPDSSREGSRGGERKGQAVDPEEPRHWRLRDLPALVGRGSKCL